MWLCVFESQVGPWIVIVSNPVDLIGQSCDCKVGVDISDWPLCFFSLSSSTWSQWSICRVKVYTAVHVLCSRECEDMKYWCFTVNVGFYE